MDAQIIRDNGSAFRLSNLNIEVQDFLVGSIEIRPNYIDVEGSHGRIDTGATYGVRTITVPFYFKAQDLHDVVAVRDKLFEVVTETDSFYIRELRRLEYQTGNNRYVGGKRYKVRLASTFDIEQTYKYGFGELVFETTDLPFAESIGTSGDIQRDGINANSGIWGFGMGLIADDAALLYKHHAVSGQKFRVYNPGNVGVHPFEQDLKITISNVVGSTEKFQITNHTNLSKSRVNVPLKSTDTVIYDGPNITRNGLQFLRDTRKDFIEMAPGWNTLEIYYCTSAIIELDFRFYYK